MAQTFQEAFAAQAPNLRGLHRRRALWLLSLPDDDPRKQAAFLHAEGVARRHLGLSPDEEVDWTEGANYGTEAAPKAINWQQIIAALMAALPAILKMFGC